MKAITSTIFSFLLLTIVFHQGACQSPDQLDAEQFETKLKSNEVQLVDVRTPEEFKKNRIPGAMNFNINDKAFANQLKGLDKNKPVLVYCLSGGRSSKAAAMMRKEGFQEVYDLHGGLMKWNAANKSLEKGVASKAGMSMADYLEAVDDEKLVLVDFHAKWCGPCKKMAPDLEALKKQYAGNLILLKIDADENSVLVDSLEVSALPTLFLYKKGKRTWATVGYKTKTEIENEIAANL